MNKRRLIVGAGLSIVLLALVLVGYFSFFSSAKNNVSPYTGIPEDAIFVLETPSFTNSWVELSKSPLWNVITKNKFYADISQDAERLDSIIQNNKILSSYFSDKHLVISAQMINENDYDFLMILDTHKDTETLMPLVEKFLNHSSIPVEKMDSNGKTFFKIAVTDEQTKSLSNYYIYYKDNLLYFSRTQSIIEKAMVTTADNCIKQLLPITYLQEEIPNGKIFKYYFNYKELVSYLQCFFPESNVWGKAVGDALSYTALDTKLDEHEAELSGITSVDLTSPSFIKALALSKPGVMTAQNIIPANVAFSISISFDDFVSLEKQFVTEYEQLDEKNYAIYQKNQHLIEKLLGIDFNKDVFSWVGKEINICKLPSASTSALNNVLLFVQANDIDQAKMQLGKIMDQIKKRTPVTFKSFDHLNYPIYQLEVKGLFKPFLGNWLQQIDKPYFTYIENFVVFSNSPQELIRLIDSYMHGDVLSGSESYQKFQKNFDDKNSFSIYIQMPKLYTNLYQYSNNKTRKELDENREFLESFSQIGIQLISKKGQFKTQVVAVHDENVSFNQTMQEMEESATDIQNVNFEAKEFMKDIGTDLAQGTLLDSIPQGLWKFYYPSRNLKGVVNFNKEGQPDKKAIFYQDKQESIPLEEMTYDDGALEDNYIEYYLKGNRKAVLQYKNGKAHGTALFYYENGATKIEGSYKKGKKVSKWKHYSPDGALISKTKE